MLKISNKRSSNAIAAFADKSINQSSTVRIIIVLACNQDL